MRRLTELVLAEMQEWQEAHPRATLEEIEGAVAVHWARVQAKVVEVSAPARATAPITTQAEAERPRCPECGHALQGRGQHRRRVQTTDDGQPGDHPGARVRGLPGLWDGSFSPSMRRWA